uniref:Uncharacterized protein n=1 Tax=Anopheles melas TaxID=34690 RepID=A0A182U4R9_9DIPT
MNTRWGACKWGTPKIIKHALRNRAKCHPRARSVSAHTYTHIHSRSFAHPPTPGQPRSEEALEGEGGGFSARQEYASEAKLHGPTTESTIVTETRRTTEATMRMEHKISFPELPPLRLSQRTQTPTVPTVTEGTSPMSAADPPSAGQQQQQQQQCAGTNTDPIATRSDATQTAPTTMTVDVPTAPSVRLPAQSESKRESSSISSSSNSVTSTVVRERPNSSFEPLLQQPADVGELTSAPLLVGSEPRPLSLLKPQPETIPTPPIGTLFQSVATEAPKFPPAPPGSSNVRKPRPASMSEVTRARSTSPRPSADAIAMERLWSTPKAFGSFGARAADEPPVCQVYRSYRPPPTVSSSSSTFTKHITTTTTQQQQQPPPPPPPQQHNYSTLPFARKQTKPHQEHNAAKAHSDSIRSDFQPIYQQPPQPQPQPQPVVNAPAPTQMYSSFSSTQQFQASSTLSQQQYSQSSMQYQPFKPSLAVEAPVRAPSPAPVPTFVPAAAAPPPQSFPPKITPFKPAPAPAAPVVAAAPAPMFAPAATQQPLNVGTSAPAPTCTLTPIAGATPAFVAGPSYNQTPQPFKPLPPPAITPSSLESLLQQQAAYGELKAPRMVQGVRLPVAAAAPLPADFGYGAIAELGLEPGPQPTMGYAPKASSERKSSYYREQIEQSLLESMDKEPERVPAGGVKIIPPSPRKKSKPAAPAGQSDTAGGVPAPLEQPAEPQQGQQGAMTKSPFTATESEYESDMDGVTGARRQNGYLADTEEVVQKTAAVSFEQQQQQQTVQT